MMRLVSVFPHSIHRSRRRTTLRHVRSKMAFTLRVNPFSHPFPVSRTKKPRVVRSVTSARNSTRTASEHVPGESTSAASCPSSIVAFPFITKASHSSTDDLELGCLCRFWAEDVTVKKENCLSTATLSNATREIAASVHC